ncbi:MAG: DsrE family protein [Planctomycetes bacterium]|nr:DsrE family protein [Planctomycetota bacterium]
MKRIAYTVMIGVAAVLTATTAGSRAEDKQPPKEAANMFKAVVHINFSDAERQKHGLKNVTNVLKEVKGEAEIVVVCHGPGIDLLVKDKSKHVEAVAELVKAKVRFEACENTLREKSIPKETLLPGVTTTPSGAVEVVRKQQEGFGYFIP